MTARSSRRSAARPACTKSAGTATATRWPLALPTRRCASSTLGCERRDRKLWALSEPQAASALPVPLHQSAAATC
eukprot:363885-Chlamydomonas_euryale.AAC.2